MVFFYVPPVAIIHNPLIALDNQQRSGYRTEVRHLRALLNYAADTVLLAA